MSKRAASFASQLLAVALLAAAGGCASQPSPKGALRPIPITPAAAHLADAVPLDKLTTATRQIAYEGVKALDAGNYRKASQLFNLALKSEVNNSGLHFFNALAYHLRAMSGEAALYQLARQGYEMSIQFDGSNAVARHYLGLLLMDQHQYAEAKTALMQAVLYTPNDPDLLYDLAVAAYYAHDPRTAYGAIEGLRQLQGDRLDGRGLRAAAIIAAASGDAKAAREDLSSLHGQHPRPGDEAFVENRVAVWNDTLGGVRMMPVQLNGNTMGGMGTTGTMGGMGSTSTMGGMGSSGTMGGMGGMGATNGVGGMGGTGMMGGMGGMGSSGTMGGMGGMGNTGGIGGMNAMGGMGGANAMGGMGTAGKPASSFYDKNMVNLEVVLISNEENNSDTFGVNLLEGLGVQFGDTSLGTPGMSWTKGVSSVTGSAATTTSSITRTIEIPGVSYSLNIANSTDTHSEVIARPSLVAMGGQASTFFSGVDVIGAAVSTGQGGSVQVDQQTGIKLTVTPDFLPDNLIHLKVDAVRAFLTNPSSSVQFDFRIDTDRTEVSANVVMKFGETLILSGLSERDVETTNDGVPGLRDVPIVQYLMSHKTKSDYYHSVLVLITPRRPSYAARSEDDIKAEREHMSELEKQQASFEDKYREWFKQVPSTALILKQLDQSEAIHEFRSGDMELDSWTSRASHGGSLRSALDFLFY